MQASITFKIIKNLAEAKKWWEIFCVPQTIYDEWELRYCFYKYFNYPLHFYLGYVHDKPIGLLALQYNTTKKYLEFFGDYEAWMDQNKLFITPGYEAYIPEFYNNLTTPTLLNSLVGNDRFTKSLPIDTYSYYLSLSGMSSYLDYVATRVSSSKRNSFKKIIKKGEQTGVETSTGTLNDLEILFDLNIQAFKEESSFLFPYRKEIFRDIARLSICKPHILTFKIKNQIYGVGLGVIYNNTYIALNAGIRKDTQFSLSSFTNLKTIDEAIKLGMLTYDVRGGNFGWKEEWCFEKIPQYKFEKLNF